MKLNISVSASNSTLKLPNGYTAVLIQGAEPKNPAITYSVNDSSGKAQATLTYVPNSDSPAHLTVFWLKDPHKNAVIDLMLKLGVSTVNLADSGIKDDYFKKYLKENWPKASITIENKSYVIPGRTGGKARKPVKKKPLHYGNVHGPAKAVIETILRYEPGRYAKGFNVYSIAKALDKAPTLGAAIRAAGLRTTGYLHDYMPTLIAVSLMKDKEKSIAFILGTKSMTRLFFAYLDESRQFSKATWWENLRERDKQNLEEALMLFRVHMSRFFPLDEETKKSLLSRKMTSTARRALDLF